MKKQPRGLRNNNPGNIRINSDLFCGEIRPSADKAFKQFENMAYGYRAMFKILSNYYNRYSLKTIRQWITRWAPENENNTLAYVMAVANYVGISPDQDINLVDATLIQGIVAGMSKVENGVSPNHEEVLRGWELLQ